MTLALALVVALAIAVPYAMRLERASPPIAIAVWIAALTLRAATAILMLVLVIFYLPGTGLFAMLTHWCWHAAIPFLATHLGFNGHSLGDAATILPALLVATSTASAAWAIVRAARAVRQLVRKQVLGRGPKGSLIIGGSDVVLAVAGVRRPRVLVSAGALTQLDDGELAAGLEHEWGHIVHRHRVLLLYGELTRALTRLIPGGQVAAAELAFHVERDADAYAISRNHHPQDLASAIRKAAAPRPEAGSLTALGDRRSVAERVRLLNNMPSPRPSLNRLTCCTAAVLASLAIWLTSATPTVAASGIRQLAATASVHRCSS